MYGLPIRRHAPLLSLLPLLAVLLGGCGGGTAIREEPPPVAGEAAVVPQPLQGFMATVDYLDPQGETVDRGEGAVPMTMLFLPVEGGVLGRIDGDTARFRARVDERDVLTVDLTGIDRPMLRVVARLPIRARTGGLKAEPKRMRLARLEMVALEGEMTPYRVHPARLVDAVAGDAIEIMYVDRPGRLTGSIRVGEGKRYFYDVEFPSRGFHLLRVRPIERGYLVHHQSSDVLLRLQVKIVPEKGAAAGEAGPGS